MLQKKLWKWVERREIRNNSFNKVLLLTIDIKVDSVKMHGQSEQVEVERSEC